MRERERERERKRPRDAKLSHEPLSERHRGVVFVRVVGGVTCFHKKKTGRPEESERERERRERRKEEKVVCCPL